MSAVIAYHVVCGTHGFWLPNDPRGSGSTEVREEHLRPFGPATYVATYVSTSHSVAARPHDQGLRRAAKAAFKHAEVRFDEPQLSLVAEGFAAQVEKSGFVVHACAVLPQHAHFVIARHRFEIEQIVRLLKQAATTKLLDAGRHPFADKRSEKGRLPSVWGEHFRKVFLFTPDEVVGRIQNVEANPIKDGRPAQHWPFVTPYPADAPRGRSPD